MVALTQVRANSISNKHKSNIISNYKPSEPPGTLLLEPGLNYLELSPLNT